jgi:hypothetical protein
MAQNMQHAAKGQKPATQRNPSEVQSPADIADQLWPDGSPADAQLSPKATKKLPKVAW